MPEFIRFEDGTLYAEAFDTPLGPVQIDAMISIAGDTLTMEEFAFRPLEQPTLPLTTAGLRTVRKQLFQVVLQAGYTRLVIAGERVTGVNPGRLVHYKRRLR